MAETTPSTPESSEAVNQESEVAGSKASGDAKQEEDWKIQAEAFKNEGNVVTRMSNSVGEYSYLYLRGPL